MFIEQRGYFFESVRLNSPCGQLECKRDTVELSADVTQQGGLDVTERDTGTACPCPFEKELFCWKCCRGLERDLWIYRRTIERWQHEDLLAVCPKCLTARRQQIYLRTGIRQT